MTMSASRNLRQIPLGFAAILLVLLLAPSCSGQTDAPAAADRGFSVMHWPEGSLLELSFGENAGEVVAISHAVVDETSCNQASPDFAEASRPTQSVVTIDIGDIGSYHCFEVEFADGEIAYSGYRVQLEDMAFSGDPLLSAWQDIEWYHTQIIASGVVIPAIHEQLGTEMESFAKEKIEAVLDHLLSAEAEAYGSYFTRYSEEIRDNLKAAWHLFLKAPQGGFDSEQIYGLTEYLARAIDRLELLVPPVFFG